MLKSLSITQRNERYICRAHMNEEDVIGIVNKSCLTSHSRISFMYGDRARQRKYISLEGERDMTGR